MTKIHFADVGMAIVMRCSVNMEFCVVFITQKIWTALHVLFHTKVRHSRMIVIRSSLFGKPTTFSPLLSSYKYVVSVKATALQFAARVFNQRLSVQFPVMAEIFANGAQILGSLPRHLVH